MLLPIGATTIIVALAVVILIVKSVLERHREEE